MEEAPKEPNKPEAQQVPEEPVKSIEGEGKADGPEKDQAQAQAKAEAEPESEEKSLITGEQWRFMMDVLMAIYEYREADGYDPSKLFHRNVNKRNVPDYYEVIKEPMALSIVKARINKREYKKFPDFVRDCILITHNAQTYNRPKSRAYEDALVIRDVFIAEFDKLVKQGIISAEDATLPDLGEIPEADPLPEELEEEHDEEEEDEEDDSDDDGRRKKKRGPRGKRDGAKDDGQAGNEPELRKKRGRPPRVDTPMEARIKTVLKGIRKFKDPSGQLKVRHFERLPDKTTYPDYYMEIKEPIAIDIMKRKSKRKKYSSLDDFMRDVDLMFNNAKAYNQPHSQIYRDAVDLQTEARKLAEKEKKKPDSEYLMEDGRLPLPDGILYKGELWKVGDWIHIQNPNDVTKPIVAQIYRTWQDSEGDKWVNACWYYRPEQTVHQFEKHFYPNEVMKTGQYRDHRIEEVVDRCFVMFVTRYNRGRPRGFPPEKAVYVCESRYNEEKHKLNKIKTWASCLPDEVREKDYEMDLFDAPRKIKKIPSPLKHLLKEDAKDTDEVPKPTWGAENAPPVLGAIHRRPRDENESPPPEPTPSPPPQPIPRPAMASLPPRQPSISQLSTQRSVGSPADVPMTGTAPPAPIRSPAAPLAPLARSPAPASPAFQQPQVPPTSVYQSALHRRSSAYAPPTPHPPVPYQPTPLTHTYPGTAPGSPYVPYQPSRLPVPSPAIYNPNAPRPIEVFHLSDSANAAIPADIREQFHRDDQGHVLFFSTPPLDIVPANQERLGHSLKYLAARDDRRRRIEERKRKHDHEQEQEQQEEAVKRRRADEDSALAARVENLTTKAVEFLANDITTSTDRYYDAVYQDKADEVRRADAEACEHRARAARLTQEQVAQIKAQSTKAAFVNLKGNAFYMDDINLKG